MDDVFGILPSWMFTAIVAVICNDPLKSCSGHNEWRSQT